MAGPFNPLDINTYRNLGDNLTEEYQNFLGIKRGEMGDKAAQQAEAYLKLLSNMTQEHWDTYKKYYGPESQVGQRVLSATQPTPAEYEQAAADAQATTEHKFAAAKAAGNRNLMRMGVNPNSGRFAGFERGAELAKAAASAGEANKARRAITDKALNTGLLLSGREGLGSAQQALTGAGNVAAGETNVAGLYAGQSEAQKNRATSILQDMGIFKKMTPFAEGGSVVSIPADLRPIIQKRLARGGPVAGYQNGDTPMMKPSGGGPPMDPMMRGPEDMGGDISGPGGPKDDMIDARLSDGEFIMDAESAKYWGTKKLREMQDKAHESEQGERKPPIAWSGPASENAPPMGVPGQAWGDVVRMPSRMGVRRQGYARGNSVENRDKDELLRWIEMMRNSGAMDEQGRPGPEEERASSFGDTLFRAKMREQDRALTQSLIDRRRSAMMRGDPPPRYDFDPFPSERQGYGFGDLIQPDASFVSSGGGRSTMLSSQPSSPIDPAPNWRGLPAPTASPVPAPAPIAFEGAGMTGAPFGPGGWRGPGVSPRIPRSFSGGGRVLGYAAGDAPTYEQRNASFVGTGGQSRRLADFGREPGWNLVDPSTIPSTAPNVPSPTPRVAPPESRIIPSLETAANPIVEPAITPFRNAWSYLNDRTGVGGFLSGATGGSNWRRRRFGFADSGLVDYRELEKSVGAPGKYDVAPLKYSDLPDFSGPEGRDAGGLPSAGSGMGGSGKGSLIGAGIGMALGGPGGATLGAMIGSQFADGGDVDAERMGLRRGYADGDGVSAFLGSTRDSMGGPSTLDWLKERGLDALIAGIRAVDWTKDRLGLAEGGDIEGYPEGGPIAPPPQVPGPSGEWRPPQIGGRATPPSAIAREIANDPLKMAALESAARFAEAQRARNPQPQGAPVRMEKGGSVKKGKPDPKKWVRQRAYEDDILYDKNGRTGIDFPHSSFEWTSLPPQYEDRGVVLPGEQTGGPHGLRPGPGPYPREGQRITYVDDGKLVEGVVGPDGVLVPGKAKGGRVRSKRKRAAAGMNMGMAMPRGMMADRPMMMPQDEMERVQRTRPGYAETGDVDLRTPLTSLGVDREGLGWGAAAGMTAGIANPLLALPAGVIAYLISGEQKKMAGGGSVERPGYARSGYVEAPRDIDRDALTMGLATALLMPVATPLSRLAAAGGMYGAVKGGDEISKMAKGGPVNRDKIAKVMHEFKAGALRSSSGQKVKNRKQALAIAMSEGRRAARPGYPGGGEVDFQKWYADHAKRLGLNPNPDDPRHHYDYRAAYRAGAGPGPDGHWPSAFKDETHPRRFLPDDAGRLRDTRTGDAVIPTLAGGGSVRGYAQGDQADNSWMNTPFIPTINVPVGQNEFGLYEFGSDSENIGLKSKLKSQATDLAHKRMLLNDSKRRYEAVGTLNTAIATARNPDAGWWAKFRAKAAAGDPDLDRMREMGLLEAQYDQHGQFTGYRTFARGGPVRGYADSGPVDVGLEEFQRMAQQLGAGNPQGQMSQVPELGSKLSAPMLGQPSRSRLRPLAKKDDLDALLNRVEKLRRDTAADASNLAYEKAGEGAAKRVRERQDLLDRGIQPDSEFYEARNHPIDAVRQWLGGGQ